MDIISKQDAKAKGLKFYYTGRPCLSGHNSSRYVSTGACVDCQRAKSLEYAAEHREEATKRARDWYQNNKERALAVGKEWYQNNKEHCKLLKKASVDATNKRIDEGRKNPTHNGVIPSTRREAIVTGSVHFNTGQPCKYGHYANRFTKGGACVICLRIKREKYNERKKELSQE